MANKETQKKKKQVEKQQTSKKLKKQEKLLEKERVKREKLIMKEKVKTYDGGFMARCVAVLIGFILGVVGTLGGIVGGGYLIASHVTIRQIAETVKNSTNGEFDITDYLAEKYVDNTLVEFFKNFSEISSSVKQDGASLSTFVEISPYAATLAEKLTSYVEKFGLKIDSDELLSTPFTQYPDFLQECVKTMELAGLLGVEPNGSILSLLCYGEEGVHFNLDTNGEVVMREGYHQLTLGDFYDNDATTNLFYRISLRAVMSINTSASFDDPIVRALVYGTKGIDYATNTSDEIVMLPLAYTYENDGSGTYVLKDDHENAIDHSLYRSASVGGHDVLALFATAPTTAEEAPKYYLLKDTADGKYYAYATESALTAGIAGDFSGRVLHTGLSLGDLTSGDFGKMFEALTIADVLNVTATSDAMLRSLAYGSENEDYKIVGGEIVMLNGAKPRTFNDLRNGDNLLSSFYVKDLLNITADSNEAIISLAYGKEGKHYALDKATNTFTMLEKVYTARKVAQAGGAPVLTLFDGDGKKVTDESAGSYDAARNVWTWSEGSGENAKIYVAKQTGLFGVYNYYVYNASDASTPLKYTPRAITELGELNLNSLLDGVTLASVLGIDESATDTDDLMMTLVYGKKGKNYEIVTEPSTGTEKIKLLPIKYSATFDTASGAYAWKDENGNAVTPVSIDSNVFEFLRTENGVTRYVYVAGVTADGAYNVRDAFTAELYHKARTISDLSSGGGILPILDDVELKTFLAEDKTDKINLYLLYGKEAKYNPSTGAYENGDYYLDTAGNVIVLTAPNTLGDLRTGTGENSLFQKLRSDLTIGDILGDVSGNRILSILSDATLDTLADKINTIEITTLFEDAIYEKDETTGEFILVGGQKKMKSEWAYLLNDPEATTQKAYTINDMSDMMENMQKNIKFATINQLNADFSLELDATFLSMSLLPSVATAAGIDASTKTTIGALTMTEMTKYIPKFVEHLGTSALPIP